MSARRIVRPTDAAAAEACALEMLALIAAARDATGRATVAISGGSSPKPMFAKMAAAGFDWTGVDIFFVDERCVPPTDSASNYKMANEYLLHPAGIPAAQVHRILGEMDPHEAARQYAAELPPVFDIVHRGLGPDAHTASLFPGDPLIDDRAGIAQRNGPGRLQRRNQLQALVLDVEGALRDGNGGAATTRFRSLGRE